ncbi:MAG: AI-2E family transporter [Candidatus Limnocylindrales bacterium]
MLRSEAWVWLARGAGAAVGVLLVAVIATLMLGASNVLVQVAIALVLAAGLEPVVRWLRGKTGLTRTLTILLVYLGFMVLVGALVFLIVPAAVSQLTEFANRLPLLLADLRSLVVDIRLPLASDALVNAIDALAAGMRDPEAEPDPETLMDAGLVVADILIGVITVVTLVFFWLTGREHMQRFALALLPQAHRATVRHGWNEVEGRLGLWVRGQAIVMSSVFVMVTVAYFAIGLPNALLLGLIAGLAEIIPIVGPVLGVIPALLVAAVSGEVELVLLVAGVYVVIQVVEGNVLVPMVMKNTIGVPPFLVIVSLVMGGAAGGLVGALLAVPLVAALMVILTRAQDRRTPVSLSGPDLKARSDDGEEEGGESGGPAPKLKQAVAEEHSTRRSP